MKSQILLLIERMNCEDTVSRNGQSVSWKAYREAERKATIEWFPFLQKIIEENPSQKSRKLRSCVYFVITTILKKEYDPDICRFLIGRLSQETDIQIVSRILDNLAQIEPVLDIEPDAIVSLSKHEKRLIRQSAIAALGTFPNPKSKAALAFYLLQDDEKNYKYESYVLMFHWEESEIIQTFLCWKGISIAA